MGDKQFKYCDKCKALQFMHYADKECNECKVIRLTSELEEVKAERDKLLWEKEEIQAGC